MALAVLGAVLAGVLLTASPASASGISAPFLYKVRDTKIAANCIPSAANNKYLGNVNLSPYFDYGSTNFQTTSGNALVVETYEELGFSTAQKYHSCVAGDFYYVYYGLHRVNRKVTIIFDCYGGSCLGPYVTYGPWHDGW
jgi:hypothetical protein